MFSDGAPPTPWLPLCCVRSLVGHVFPLLFMLAVICLSGALAVMVLFRRLRCFRGFGRWFPTIPASVALFPAFSFLALPPIPRVPLVCLVLHPVLSRSPSFCRPASCVVSLVLRPFSSPAGLSVRCCGPWASLLSFVLMAVTPGWFLVSSRLARISLRFRSFGPVLFPCHGFWPRGFFWACAGVGSSSGAFAPRLRCFPSSRFRLPFRCCIQRFNVGFVFFRARSLLSPLVGFSPRASLSRYAGSLSPGLVLLHPIFKRRHCFLCCRA